MMLCQSWHNIMGGVPTCYTGILKRVMFGKDCAIGVEMFGISTRVQNLYGSYRYVWSISQINKASIS